MKRIKYRTSISLNNNINKPKKNINNNEFFRKSISPIIYKSFFKKSKLNKLNSNLNEQNINISNFLKKEIKETVIPYDNYPLINRFKSILKLNNSPDRLKNIKSINQNNFKKSNLKKCSKKKVNIKSDFFNKIDILSTLKKNNNKDNYNELLSNSKSLLLKENQQSFISKKNNKVNYNDNTEKTNYDKKILIKNLFLKEITENYLTDISKDIINMTTTYRNLFKIQRLTDSEQSDDDAIIIDDTSNYVIHPYNKYLMIYRIIIFFLIFYNILFYPFFFAFDIHIPYFLYLFVDILFIFDFFIGFFIGFFNEDGELVNNLIQVCIYNLKKKFLTNLITDFPFSFLPYKKYYFLKILFIIRFFKILQFQYKEEESEHYYESNIFNVDIIKSLSIHQPFYSFIEFFIGLFIFIHLWSCIFILISKDYFPNWLSKTKSLNNLKLIDMNNFTIYLSAFYFVLTTIITVGYGDITVGNNTERIFDLFLMIFGVCIYSCVISILSSLFEEWEENKYEKNKEIIVLDKLYHKYIFSNSLYCKILRFLKQKMIINSTSKNFLIKSLPIHYKSTLLFEINKNYLSRLNFFKEKSYDFQYSAVKYLKEINFIKKEYIVQTNDLLEEMYFIKNGVIEFQKNYLGRGVIKILKMRQNEHFGEIYMAMGIHIPFDIISISKYVELFFLKKSDFVTLYEDFPDIIGKILDSSLQNTFRIEKRTKMLFEKNEKESQFELYKNYQEYENDIKKEKNNNLDIVKEETFTQTYNNDDNEKYSITKNLNEEFNEKNIEITNDNNKTNEENNNNDSIIKEKYNYESNGRISSNSILNIIKIPEIENKNTGSLKKKKDSVNLNIQNSNINKVSSFKFHSKKVIFSFNKNESSFKKKNLSSNKNFRINNYFENKDFCNIHSHYSPKIKEKLSLTFNETSNNQQNNNNNNLLKHIKTEEFNLPIIKYKKTNKDNLNKTIIKDKKYKKVIKNLTLNPSKSIKSCREKNINNINFNLNFNIQNNFKIEKSIKTKNSTKSSKKIKEKTNINKVLNNLKGLSENLKNPFNFFKNIKNKDLNDKTIINNNISRFSLIDNLNTNLNINNIYEIIEQIDKISEIYDIILLNWKK